MVMEKTPSSTSEKVVEVVSLMRSHVQGAKCVLDAGAELGFILPAGETSAFPALFQELERRKEELGLAGFGVSVTTMEEVFLKVKDESDEGIESRLRRKGTLRPSSDRPPVEPAEHTPPPTEGENVGIRLWWQQYYGLLVKKTLDTVRYWQVFIAMCLLPIVATLLSLLLFVFLNGFAGPDPARELSVENTAIDTDNQILFWAKFGDIASAFDFESLGAEDVGATEFLNITAGVEVIMDSVQSTSNVSACCDYQYQILDKYCALRSADELNLCTGSNFGYRHCKNCLECCTSRFGGDASCTNPFTQLSSSDTVCPAVPKVSVTDVTGGTASGRLDSDNAFVAEFLLRYAEGFSNYQTQVVGGLTIGREEPVYSACGCSSPSEFTESYVAPLQQCSESATGGDRSYVLSGAFEWYNSTDCSSLLTTTVVGGVGSGLPATPVAILAPLNASVRVDGSSLGALQALSCSTIDASSLGSDDSSVQEGCGQNSTGERPVSAFFPEQTVRTSVTVWYSGKPWHMSAAMLNVFYNVWLRELTGEGNISITVNNHPLPRSNEGQLEALLQSGNGYLLGVVVVGGFSLLLSLFILPLLNEKNSQVKHLQHISGVWSSTYWTSILTLDALLCAVVIPVVVAFFAAFQLEEFAGENLAAVAVLLVVCCMSGIPLVYLFSFAFTNGLTAFAVLVFLLFLLSSQVARASLATVTSIALQDTLNYIFLTVPTYG
jgi:ATP-binding cassette subfamily A (ABC1) protein 3